MKCGDMIKRVRRQLPTATVESISDEEIRFELNAGVNECNRLAKVYSGYSEFNAVPEKELYSLSESVPNYLGIIRSGIWFYDANGKSKYLFRKTRFWLDLNIRNWRDAVSGDPNWYWLEGDELGFYNKTKSVTKIRVYHLVKAKDMGDNDSYPWSGTATEMISLQGMDDAIIAYARWKLSPAVGAVQPGVGYENPLYLEFIREVKKGKVQCKRRPDMVGDIDNYPRIDGMATDGSVN